MFLDSQEGVHDTPVQKDGLQMTALTYLTECYTSCCVDGHPCYAYSCLKQVKVVFFSQVAYYCFAYGIATVGSGTTCITPFDACRTITIYDGSMHTLFVLLDLEK